MQLSVNDKTMLSLQLDQIAQQCYGNGFAEGKSGGNGYVGMLGGHVVKMYTHRDEYSQMDQLDAKIKDRIARSCDALRTNLSNIAARYLDPSVVKNVRSMLGMNADGVFLADRPLLTRKVVASALKTIENAAQVSLSWKGVASHSSKGFKTDYETRVRTTLQPDDGQARSMAMSNCSKNEHIEKYLKKSDSMAWSDEHFWPDIAPQDRIKANVTNKVAAHSTGDVERKDMDLTSRFGQRHFTMADLAPILKLDESHNKDCIQYDLEKEQFYCQGGNGHARSVFTQRALQTLSLVGVLRSLGLKPKHDNLATFALVRYGTQYMSTPPTVGQVKFLCELKEKLKPLENVLTPIKHSIQTTKYSNSKMNSSVLLTNDLYELLTDAGKHHSFDQQIREAVLKSSSAEEMCEKIVTAYKEALRSLK